MECLTSFSHSKISISSTSISLYKNSVGSIIASIQALSLRFSSMFLSMDKSYSTGNIPSAMSLMLMFVMQMASLDIIGPSFSLPLSHSFCTLYIRLPNQNQSKKIILLEAHHLPQLDVWSTMSGNKSTTFSPPLQSTTQDLWQKLSLDLFTK